MALSITITNEQLIIQITETLEIDAESNGNLVEKLSPWEVDFLKSIREQLENDWVLTARQLTKLDEVLTPKDDPYDGMSWGDFET